MAFLMIDLHCHSHYSDGELSPGELIELAASQGVKMIALTDHDTVAGIEEMQKYARPYGIKVISGVEISVNWMQHEIHIIGLGIDTTNHYLMDALALQAQKREVRAKLISEKLAFTKIEDIFAKVKELANGKIITRPHFAQLLVEEGICKSIGDAFKKYLQRGRVAYVASDWLSIEEAVKAITQSDGVAVIAHPLKYKLSASKMKKLIMQFKDAGGQALEVVSGIMPGNQINQLKEVCGAYKLMASTGSDFHGQSYSKLLVGRQSQMPQGCEPVWTRWLTE